MRLNNSLLKMVTVIGISFTVLLSAAEAQTDALRAHILKIIQNAAGNIGVSIIGPKPGDTISFNSQQHFPMQSVFKFPLALDMMHEIELGQFTLDQPIHISSNDLLPDTWSPLRDRYPNGNTDISLRELMKYVISQSDNNGCDILFRLLGGPGKVNNYIQSLGFSTISITANETEMHKNWEVQFANWAAPAAITQLFEKFYHGDLMNSANRDFLWKALIESNTGPGKLKGLLPQRTIVGHKSGWSGSDAAGLTAANIDAGIVILPDGRHFTIAVFISDTMAGSKDQDDLIAEISRSAWDYFTTSR